MAYRKDFSPRYIKTSFRGSGSGTTTANIARFSFREFVREINAPSIHAERKRIQIPDEIRIAGQRSTFRSSAQLRRGNIQPAKPWTLSPTTLDSQGNPVGTRVSFAGGISDRLFGGKPLINIPEGGFLRQWGITPLFSRRTGGGYLSGTPPTSRQSPNT